MVEPRRSAGQVAVVGGGVVGLCTAHFLREAGCEVTLVERREAVALETSHANGGLLTPAMSDPWNAPGLPWHLLRWLGRDDTPMVIRPGALAHYLGWGVKFLANSRERSFREAMRANFQLSSYSQALAADLRARIDVDFGLVRRGSLKVFREATTFEVSAARSSRLREFGLQFTVLDRDGVVQLEPVLAGVKDAIVGGIHYPMDESGDSHLFCRALADSLRACGVSVRTGCEVQGVGRQCGSRLALVTTGGTIECDAVVVAAAAWSVPILARLGVDVAVRPVKGYSLTLTVDDQASIPTRPVVDDDLHAAATPFGTRVRLAGTAEFCGWDARMDAGRLNTLWGFLDALVPAVARRIDRSNATAWCGFRPVSADGRPFIGATRVPGIFVNTGHGHLGWTQAIGSAAALAQVMTDQPPAIDLSAFDPTRGSW